MTKTNHHIDCEICKRIELIKQDKEPYFIKKYQTGYLSLFDNQAYPGYCLFIYKDSHKEEIYELGKYSRQLFFNDLCNIVERLEKLYKPKKINYAVLGNGTRHLHVHIIPNNEGARTIWHRGYRENFDYNIQDVVEKIRSAL